MAEAGYFASRCKAPAGARRKIAGRRHCRAGPPAAPSPSQKAVGAALVRHAGPRPTGHERQSTRRRSPRLGRRRQHEARDVLRRELDPQGRPQRVDAERAQIVVEVAEPRRQCDRLDPGRFGALGQTSSPPRRRPDRCRGRYRAGAASAGTAWRRDARPRARPPSAWSAARSEATAWSRCLRRPPARRSPTPKRTALPRRSPIARRGVSIGALPRARRIEPGAMRAGDLAVEIGDARRSSPARSRSASPRRGDSSSAGGSAGCRFRAKP